MAAKDRKKLGELLVDYNYITENQLERALQVNKESDKKIGEILVDLDFIAEEDLIQVLEFQRGIPHANLEQYYFDPSLENFLPENIARRHLAVPMEKSDDGTLKVAMADPTNLVAIDDIERVSNLHVEPLYGAPSKIRNALERLYGDEELDISGLFDEEPTEDDDINKNGEIEENVEEEIDKAPIIKLANTIISNAYKKSASDIHIEPEKEYIRVRYRIDGVLQEEMKAPKSSHRALVSRLKVVADLDITEHRVPQDGRIQMKIKEENIDMRVSTLPTVNGEKVVIRILTQDTGLLNIGKLGFTDENLNKFNKLIRKPHGILLLTGPTGSGKSTTLFAGLNELKDPAINMVTIEDPVEYKLEGVYQVQAKPKAGLTFAKTLRSILRQDPDIIMVGEMRDSETAEIAVRAALTGHLVFSTLHTNDAVSSVNRLIDMGLPPYLVSSAVNGIISQRLVRRLCNECKMEYELTEADKNYIGDESIKTGWKAVGCNKCNKTGYNGRVAIQEVFMLDDDIKDMVAQQASTEQIKKSAREKGMETLKEDGIKKFQEGLTDLTELKRIIF